MTKKDLLKVLKLVPNDSRITVDNKDLSIELKQDQDGKWSLNIVINNILIK